MLFVLSILTGASGNTMFNQMSDSNGEISGILIKQGIEELRAR